MGAEKTIFPCELPGTDRQDKLGNFKKLPIFFYDFGKRNADTTGNSFVEWSILKISGNRKQIPAPKMNHGCRKTKWKIFKNYQHVKKNNGIGFSNMELKLGVQMHRWLPGVLARFFGGALPSLHHLRSSG